MTTIANVEMAAVWDGPEGDEWTENADRYDATDRFLARRFASEVPIASSDRVLDIGCGTGKSTRDAALRASEGSVLGVDLSARMLADARRRSEEAGITNVEYLQADAQVHAFPEAAFDVAISVFGVMFFADPVAAFDNIGRALRPGGSVAFLAWQAFEHNEWLTVIFDAMARGRDLPTPPPGVAGPFGLADDERVCAMLRDAGYANTQAVALDEPMWLGGDSQEAWDFLSSMGLVRGLADGLAGSEREDALEELRAIVASNATTDGVVLGSAAWLFTAERV